MGYKKFLVVVFIAVTAIAMLSSGTFAASVYTETWDNGGLEGWRRNTTKTNVEVRDTGGNPDGYLYSYGTVGDSFDIGAATEKEAFTGDYGTVNGVSVDLLFISGAFDNAWLRFRYESSFYNGWKYPLTETFPTGEWFSYAVTFDPTWTDSEAFAAGWIQEPLSPTFSETMANVYTAEVRLSGQGFLEAGIDNYSNVPIPSAVILLGSGLAGLVGLRKKSWFRRQV